MGWMVEGAGGSGVGFANVKAFSALGVTVCMVLDFRSMLLWMYRWAWVCVLVTNYLVLNCLGTCEMSYYLPGGIVQLLHLR